jgi:hypothetical protein
VVREGVGAGWKKKKKKKKILSYTGGVGKRTAVQGWSWAKKKNEILHENEK